MAIEFFADIETLGNLLIARLPAEASAQLPSRSMVYAEGTMNGIPVALPLEPDGYQGHFALMDEAQITKAGAKPGEGAAFCLTPVEDWPQPDLPEAFQAALEEANLLIWWDGLTVKAKWEWVRWIRAAQSPLTREKRIQVGISKLQSGMRRPCCFNTASCTLPEVSKSGKLKKV